MEVSLTSPTLPLPTGFSILEQLDKDPVATAYLIGDGVGGEAVLTVARSAAPAEVRAAYRRWAGALLAIADGTSIVRVFAADVTPDGRPFLVTGSGAVLGDQLDENGPLPVTTGVVYGRALADALARAHSAGISHGTVQPATILTEAGRAVLAGFGGVAPGLAVATAADAYTPPELLPDALVGRAVATAPGDVYQLGITLYVALGGKLPWQDTPLDLSARSTPLAETPAVRGELLELLRAMTLTDPAARPNAGQVRDWLAKVQPDGTREQRAIPRELLAGRGVRKVGRRTAALASIAGGAGGATAGTLAIQSGSATTATAPTTAAALPTEATTPTTIPAVGPAVTPLPAVPTATTTGAATTGAVSAGVSVTKVVVITVVSAVVGVGGVVGANEILSDGPCDSVVIDRPLETVLTSSVEYLKTSAYSFRLRYLNQINAEGTFDAAAKTASVELKPPGRYVGKVQLTGDDLALSGPVGGTPAGQWAHRSASSDPVARTVLAIPDTVATLLAGAKAVERDGCNFSGQITNNPIPNNTGQPLNFQATIADGTGDLHRLSVGAGQSTTAIDLEVTKTGAGATPATTTTIEPPPRTDLTGRWVGGKYALLINGLTAGITANDRPICTGELPSGGTSVDITFRCLPGSLPDETVSLNVELTGADRVTVRGYADFDGTYRLAGS
jgi:hypothetical protein